MPKPLTADPRMFHLLHRVHQSLFRAGDKVLSEALGITTTQSAVLMFLKNADGASMGELAKAIGLKITSASGLVDRMEKKDLVVRRRSATDKRSIEIGLTANGRSVLAEAEPLVSSSNKQMLNKISEQGDVNAFVLACENIISAAEELYQSASPAPTSATPVSNKSRKTG